MDNRIKIHDLGVPLFLETPIYVRWFLVTAHMFVEKISQPSPDQSNPPNPCLSVTRSMTENFKAWGNPKLNLYLPRLLGRGRSENLTFCT